MVGGHVVTPICWWDVGAFCQNVTFRASKLVVMLTGVPVEDK